jgi:hypothetical protein
MGPLHVIAVISNPIRFASRYRLFLEFQERMLKEENVVLHAVEIAHGERPHAVTFPVTANHYQLNTHDEVWIKENLVKIGMRKLPPDAKYIAWVDADVWFMRPDWALETIHQLQHFKIVQMFTHAIDLGPSHEPLQQHTGYVYKWIDEGRSATSTPKYGPHGLKYHPGFAWAARRETLEELGGIIDWAILGAGDTHMAGAFTGVVEKTFAPGMTEGYKASLIDYQDRCERIVDHDVGYVETGLYHYWHGKKKDRGYWDRWKILSDNQYDPHTDITYDLAGVLHLRTGSERLRHLRHGIMNYFRSRNEDSIDL